MKRIVCLLLAIMQLLLCLTACSHHTSPTEPENPAVHTYPSEIPTYADSKEMSLIAFLPPPSTEQWYQSMVDCGFTAAFVRGALGSNALLNSLALCDRVGLDAYITVDKGVYFEPLEVYGQYKSFKGIITDEPGPMSQLDLIQQNREKLHSSYPNQDLEYITNFYPMLGGGAQNDFLTYEEYVRYYMDNGGKDENALMFDIYPLKENGKLDYNWLLRLESLAPIAKEYGVDFYSFLSTLSIKSQKCRRPEEDDMRYTSYVNMAYGVKGFGYFCYVTPKWGEFDLDKDFALVQYEDGNDLSTYYKTSTWYAVQTVNNELKAFDHVFLSFDWQGVMKSHGSEATTNAGATCFLDDMNFLESYDGIKKLSSTEDALLGLFTDENGYDGFMLVNFADPYYDKENTVTLELDGATRAIVYIKGQPQVIELVDGNYTVTLEPGEGQFIIPLS